MGQRKSRAEEDARRQEVLRYYLHGYKPTVIVQILTAAGHPVTVRTVQRDVEELEVELRQKIDAALLWPIREHVALMREIIREAFVIYHRPKEKRTIPLENGEFRTVELDDSFRKLQCLDRVVKVGEGLAKIAFPNKEAAPSEGVHDDPVKMAMRIIEALPFEEKERIITALREQYVKAAASTP